MTHSPAPPRFAVDIDERELAMALALMAPSDRARLETELQAELDRQDRQEAKP